MKKTQLGNVKTNSIHSRSLQRSSTLNRKYVKKPVLSSDSKITITRKTQAASVGGIKNIQATKRGLVSPIDDNKNNDNDSNNIKELQNKVMQYPYKKKKEIERPSANELKNQAIEQALRSVAETENNQKTHNKKTTKAQSKKIKDRGYGKRFALAAVCAAICVAVLVGFVNLNMPDISVKVAAMQIGIDASYPSYVPRDFTLSGVTSEDGKITMEFKGPENTSFTLKEEKSSWDSTALLNKYVKERWGENYTATREQGITIYMAGSDAVWVNGGLMFTISSTNGALTKKQIRSIVTSL